MVAGPRCPCVRFEDHVCVLATPCQGALRWTREEGRCDGGAWSGVLKGQAGPGSSQSGSRSSSSSSLPAPPHPLVAPPPPTAPPRPRPGPKERLPDADRAAAVPSPGASPSLAERHTPVLPRSSLGGDLRLPRPLDRPASVSGPPSPTSHQSVQGSDKEWPAGSASHCHTCFDARRQPISVESRPKGPGCGTPGQGPRPFCPDAPTDAPAVRRPSAHGPKEAPALDHRGRPSWRAGLSR